MKNKYIETRQKLQDNKDLIQSLNEQQNEICNNYKDLNENNIQDYKREQEENYKKIHYVETEQEILLNNLLYIQQQLLTELLEIFKSKYIDKRIGEKTKEKIQNDFNTYILGNYNIECYCYISQCLSYREQLETKISLYFADYYYVYDLKQEQLKYNHETKENYFYYYRNIKEYTNIEEIEEQAKRLRDNYDLSLQKIKALKKEIEKIRGENNENNFACIKSTYIDIREC